MHRLLVLLSAVCFGTTGTASALGAVDASPVTVGAARITLGALGLHLVAGAAARSGGRHAALLPRSRMMWLGAAGVAAYQVSFFLAVRATGVAVGTVVALGSAPVITGALGWAAGQGRPAGRWGAATALAVTGLCVLVLAPHDGTGTRLDPVGVLLALGASASYAVYTVAAKDALSRGEGAEATMATLFTGGAVVLAPVFVLFPTGWLATPRGLAEVAWLGLVPTALAYVLFARGLRRLSAAEVSTLTLAEPLTATALGVLLLGESLRGTSLAGAGLLLLGLVVLGLRSRRERQEAPDDEPAEAPAASRPVVSR